LKPSQKGARNLHGYSRDT
jgi:hypothetical protein